MKKIFTVLLFVFLLFGTCNNIYAFSKTKVDLLLKKIDTKISQKDEQTQLNIYRKLRNKLAILKLKNKNEKNKELIEYLYSEIDTKFSNVSTNISKKEKPAEKTSGNTSLIYSYYRLIGKGSFQEAYEMKYKPTLSYEKFLKNYQSDENEYYSVESMKELPTGEYQFYISIFSEEEGIQRYQTVMKIINNQLQTVSAKKVQKIISEQQIINNHRVYIEKEGGKSTLFVENNFEKKKIAEVSIYQKEDGTYSFTSHRRKLQGIEVIGNGNIVTYKNTGYEFTEMGFYNIQADKLIKEGGKNTYGLTSDKKYFYICSPSGMSGGGVRIYNYLTFDLYKDVTSDITDGIQTCHGYESKKNILRVESIENKIYEYDFESGFIK
ncbi:MAG: hypothetical protein GY828_01535 [Candidatus Gracilibacteria bacterium]|nr:hypothetical protein [Candidatus Gracilibacteria bacterium]